MAQIHEYSAPEGLGLKPSNLGTDATAAAARRVQSLFSETAESQKATGASIGRGIAAAGEAGIKQADHFQISRGSQAFSSLMAAKTKQWEDISKNADPNDDGVAQRFLSQNLEPDLQKFGQGFLTEKAQAWAEQHVASFRQHMNNKTAADMSALAGQALKENHEKTVNNLASNVWSDPSKANLDFSLGALKSSIDGVVDSSPNLRGVDAGKARTGLMLHGSEALVKSAAQSHISKTAQMPDWLSDPKYAEFIKPGEMQTLLKQEQAQRKMNMYYERATAQFEKAQQTEAAKAEHSRNWTDNVKFDADGKATIKPEFFTNTQKIEEKYPGATTSESKAMINWGQSQLRERREIINTDPDTHQKLLTGLFDANRPTTRADILTAGAQGKLSAHDQSTMLQLEQALEERPLKGPIYHDTMEAAKATLGDSELGKQNYAKFVQTFIPAYQEQVRKGTLPPNALDLKDENSLISQALKPWHLTPQQKMLGRAMKNIGIGVDPSALEGWAASKAAPAAAARGGVPEPKDLKKDTVYDTPKGKLKWDGAKWVTP